MIFFLALIQLGETIPDEAFSYQGKYPREEIIYDPCNCPHFERAYQSLRKELRKEFNEKEILQTTLLFTQEGIFDLSLCNNVRVQNLIHSYKDHSIPLEYFIQSKTGVCRHIALTLTLLIQRLIDDHILHGNVFLIRDETLIGRHAWTLFVSETGAFHLDAFLGTFEDGKTRAGFSHLCQKYGNETMQKQKTRWSDGQS